MIFIIKSTPIDTNLWFHRAINDFPEFKELILSYVKKLEDSFPIFHPPYDPNGQSYERVIELAFGCYYTVVWDVGRAMAIIQEQSIQPQDIELKNLMKHVDETNLTQRKVEKAFKSKEPVIVIDYEPIREKFAIDGNHRIASNILRTARKKISAYVLSSEQHIECMMPEVCRKMYKVHRNIRLIEKYKHGEITREELDATLWEV